MMSIIGMGIGAFGMLVGVVVMAVSAWDLIRSRMH